MLVLLARPLNVFHPALLMALCLGFTAVLAVRFGRSFFELRLPPATDLAVVAAIIVIAVAVLVVVARATSRPARSAVGKSSPTIAPLHRSGATAHDRSAAPAARRLGRSLPEAAHAPLTNHR